MIVPRLFRLVLLIISVTVAASAAAADFRVENAVYIGEEPHAQSQGVTIFYGVVVYDFLKDPAEIMVFDKAHGRFVLLDTARRVQCELSTDEVQEFVERAKKLLSTPKNPAQMRWLANPAFVETFDSQTSELTLRNDWMTYQVQLLTPGPDVAAEYREFSDWYAKFNHVLNPQSRPPFPRMMLDAAMERNHGIAKEVRLTTNFSKSPKPTKITSRHELTGQLDASDKKRVAEAREAMKGFQRVSVQEYVQTK